MPAPEPRPAWARSLPGRILEHVTDPRWGGGLHRDQLAELTGCQPWDKDFISALWALRGMKRIDFCGREWVVAP